MEFIVGGVAMKIVMVGIVLFVLVLGYLGYVFLSGYFLIRAAPREDMFMCPKGHGPLPKSALINFMGEEYCSICFHNKMRQAERGELK